jgi:sec-independent protein translocase protein TatA
MTLALIGPLGLPELLIILFIVIMIFGAKRLGSLGKGLGQGIRGFKTEMKDLDEEDPEADGRRDPDRTIADRHDEV